MKTIIEAAPAKINLYLDIESRRDDRYHNIKSIMHSITLSDSVIIKLGREGRRIGVTCDDPEIPGGEGNIAYRAADLFLGMAGVDCSVDIEIQKNIPAAAGLGGGSSDAAAVLRGLNKLLGRPFSYEGLCRMGERIGADVSFCIAGGCAEAGGIGEKLQGLPTMPEASIVVSCAGKKISTPEAYRLLDEAHGNFENRKPQEGHYALAAAVAARDIREIAGLLYNIFEDCILPRHTEAAEIKETMLGSGALASLMSGSGPAVFGIFADSDSAAFAMRELESKKYSALSCFPAGALAL